MKRIITVTLCFILFCAPAFPLQQDRFVFGQLKYDGMWDPYPETWQDILEFIVTTTSIRCEGRRRVVSLDDPALFSTPFLVILGSGIFPALNERERASLRRFLSNGGTIFAEDSTGLKGSAFDGSFRREIAKAFPESRLKRLTPEHPVFRAYYLLRKAGGRRLTSPFIEGLDVGGRAALIYSQNDLIGAWAKDRLGNYLWECVPGGQTQRFEAQKLTQNILLYSVTGTYKSDAIHQQYLNRKLER